MINHIRHNLFESFKNLNQDVSIENVIHFIYTIAFVLCAMTIILSIIVIIISLFKKNTHVILGSIYTIIIALCIERIGKLFTIMLNHSFTINDIISVVVMIFALVILLIIIKVCRYLYLNKSNNKEFDDNNETQFNEFKDNLLIECSMCHNKYKKGDTMKVHQKDVCKFCVKEHNLIKDKKKK